MSRGQPLRQFAAIHAGHSHIGEQQIDRTPHPDNLLHGLDTVMSTEDLISAHAQNFVDVCAHRLLINDQNGVRFHHCVSHPASDYHGLAFRYEG